MTDIYHSSLNIEKDTRYFLYIGSIRNYGQNIFLAEALARIHRCKFDFISVVQDVLKHYSYPNLMVVNPLVNDLSAQPGKPVSKRIPTKAFLSLVSDHPQVLALVDRLLEHQGELFIFMYQSMPEMRLDRIPGVTLLGPDSQISEKLNSKIYQYQSCGSFVPMLDYRICRGKDALLRATEKLWPEWSDGIFISKEYSAGGLQNTVARGPGDITGKFADPTQTYLISRFLPHSFDPTVLAAVAGENEVYIAGVADQFIEKGTRFVGSVFPSVLDSGTVSKLKKHTRDIGKWLARHGFRGIFGCDYVVDAGGRVFLVEVNARKQGTTMEFCCVLENALPQGSALLPELEYYAVTEGRFPENTVEPEEGSCPIHWGTYYYKNAAPVNIRSSIPQKRSQREAFKNIAKNRQEQDLLILEHIGGGFVAAEGSFIARIIALGKNRESVLKQLQQAKADVEQTLF